MTEEQTKKAENSWLVVAEHRNGSLLPALYSHSEGAARAAAIEIVLGDNDPDVACVHVYQRAGSVKAEIKPTWTGPRA